MANILITKNSSTPGIVPLAGELTEGELAINTADGKLYVKNSIGTILLLNEVPTPSSILADLSTVDGTGSGLDADMLDGQHAASFQPVGTYNTIIGTDTDITTSGATIVGDIQVNDGVITSMGTRVITLVDLGYNVSTAVTNNSLVQRTGVGDVYARHYFTDAADVSTSVTKVCVEINNDGIIRHGDAPSIKEFIGIVDDSDKVDGFHVHSSTTGQFGVVPKIDAAGITDLGGKIDLHHTADATDYDWRIQTTSDVASALEYANEGGVVRFEFLDSGELRADGNVVSFYSDERLKENITPITDALETINKWQAIYYNATNEAKELSNGAFDPQKTEVGLLAQEVQEDFPEVISPAPFDTDASGNSISGEDYLTLQYSKLVPVIIAALQDQIRINSNLQDQINSLRLK